MGEQQGALHSNHRPSDAGTGPTRCSLLSGRLPHHVSEANFQNDYVGGFIHRNMTIIADKLKAQGYRTAHVGKWCDQLSIDANINNMPEFAIES